MRRPRTLTPTTPTRVATPTSGAIAHIDWQLHLHECSRLANHGQHTTPSRRPRLLVLLVLPLFAAAAVVVATVCTVAVAAAAWSRLRRTTSVVSSLCRIR